MLGGRCGLTSWLLRMPLDDEGPGTLCCLKRRPAGELSRDECGVAVVEGEREVDTESEPLLKVPVARGMCTTREEVCAGWRSFGGHRGFCEVTLFVLFSSVLFAGCAVCAGAGVLLPDDGLVLAALWELSFSGPAAAPAPAG